MTKNAQTTLGGMKENSQCSKVPTQSWGGMKEFKKSQNNLSVPQKSLI
jgi:hypothetical protein